MLTTLGSTRLATIRDASSKSVSRGFNPASASVATSTSAFNSLNRIW